MATVKLNNSQFEPAIAFGTGTALYGKDAADQVKAALDAGVIHIDAAQSYGNEESVGDAIQQFLQENPSVKRTDLYITTKLSTLPESGSVLDGINISLKKLKLDYVDSYLIHNPTKIPSGQLSRVWKEMEDVQNGGLARSIGVSNFRVKDLEEILDKDSAIPTVNQIEYHPYVYRASEKLLEFHRKHGIITSVFGGLSPLFRVKGAPLSGLLAGIRGRIQKSGAEVTDNQIMQKWLLQKGMIVVTTSSKPQRIQEALRAAELPELEPSEMEAIDTSAGDKHQRFFQPHMDK